MTTKKKSKLSTNRKTQLKRPSLLASAVDCLNGLDEGQDELERVVVEDGELFVLFRWDRQDFRLSISKYEDDSMQVAKKGDFESVAFPKTRSRVKVSWHFSADEAELLKRGFVPQSMDDKWFIYFDPKTHKLNIHRSWSGFCLFVMKLLETRKGVSIKELWANRDPDQYENSDDLHDVKLAKWVLDSILLGDVSAFPIKKA
jgi:hypothetical protein